MIRSHLLVLAKSPLPGRVKTRLCPPFDLDQAAELAEAALADTLAAVVATGAERKLLALDGPTGPWVPEGVEVFPQRGGGLDERLAWAWERAGGPGLQIGMDTPQVDAALLESGLELLLSSGTGSVLGHAADGGWWAIGLRRPDPGVFLGVPMSTSVTGVAQERRLRERGLRPGRLPTLRDVDDISDAEAVAELAPDTRFARAYRGLAVPAR
ncbi:MAG TPA: DUF2064 domain-containing protein [Acidimicrobiales bacterium]|nr:DUF2064 domain-containing protein [Acidimicrobiales bacterium]